MVVQHGYGKSILHGGFNGTIICKWAIIICGSPKVLLSHTHLDHLMSRELWMVPFTDECPIQTKRVEWIFHSQVIQPDVFFVFNDTVLAGETMGEMR